MPMAQAQPGATLRISWPANNHATPFGDSIAAMGVNVYRTGADLNIAGQQPYATLDYSQNCQASGFDQRLVSGAASATQLCWADIQMPATEGKHTFVWEWKWPAPNSPPYLGVWDVQVGSNLSPAPAPAPSSGNPSPNPGTGTGTGGCDESVCQQFQATCRNGGCVQNIGGQLPNPGTGGQTGGQTGGGSTCTAGGNRACQARGQTCVRQQGNRAWCGTTSNRPSNGGFPSPPSGGTQGGTQGGACPSSINQFCRGMGCSRTADGRYRCGTSRSGFGNVRFTEVDDVESTGLNGASKLLFSWAIAVPLIAALGL